MSEPVVVSRPELVRTVVSQPENKTVVSKPDTRTVVSRSDVTKTVVSKPTAEKVLVRGIGGRGPRGLPGATGPVITHTQTSPAASWPIQHNLGRFPLVSVIVDGVQEPLVDVEHIDTSNLVIVYAEPTPGLALLY